MAAIESSTANANDLKEVKDTLYSISERLKYYFKNLSLEDNFDATIYLSLQQNNTKVSALQIVSAGLMSDYVDLENETNSRMSLLEKGIDFAVSKGDLTNQINLEPDTLTISGNRLVITGDNLSLDENNNLTVEGNITATSGKIAGWSLSTYDNKPCIDGGTNGQISCNTYNCLSDIYLKYLQVSGNPGSTNLSYCDLDVAGATILMNDGTTWNNTFTLGDVHVDQDIRAGILTGASDAWTDHFYAEAGVYTKRTGGIYSDERKKKDVETIPKADADTILKKIAPVTFRWNDDNKPDVGFIAQDIEEIENELQLNYGLTEEARGSLSLNYEGVMMLLLKKLIDQTERINELAKNTA